MHRRHDHVSRNPKESTRKTNPGISNYSKTARYKVTTRKATAFLWTSNKRVELDIKKLHTIYASIPQNETLSCKSNKLCEKSMWRELQNAYQSSEEIKELNKRRHLPRSWTGRLSVSKMSVLPTDRSPQGSPNPTSSKLLCGYWQTNSKVYTGRQKTQNSQRTIKRTTTLEDWHYPTSVLTIEPQ